MIDLRLVRIDFRLIHGQVITKWLKHASADRIIILDDELAQDDFMKEIYIMSAPPGIKVDVYSLEQGIKEYEYGNLENGKILLLFRNVKATYNSIKLGLPINKIQIGGLGGGPGRKKIYGPISLDDFDYQMLKELHDSGILIEMHQVPDEPKMEFTKAIQRYEKESK